MCGGSSYTAFFRCVKLYQLEREGRLTRFQEDDNPTLHIVAAFLLFDGRANENDPTFENMMEEGAFPRLVALIQAQSVREDARLHQMLMELMYESSRIQRLKWEDFSTW
jgi:hypothetical protein